MEILETFPRVFSFWKSRIKENGGKFEGFERAEKQEIVVLVFYTNASKFSCKWRLGFTDQYMENQNIYWRLCVQAFISDFLKFER